VKSAKARDKHVVPQHRRWLTNPKVKSFGSPQQRQRVENSRRVMVARKRVHEHQREKLGAAAEEEDKPENLLEYQSLVEKKIQIAMADGVFENLKLKGADFLAAYRGDAGSNQRLVNRNPYVNNGEFLMNRMMENTGVVPEWIQLGKDLDAEVELFRVDLARCHGAALAQQGKPSSAVADRTGRWAERVRGSAAPQAHYCSTPTLGGGRGSYGAAWRSCSHMIKPLVELYGGCMIVWWF
jgi:hypothetical protein